MITLRPYQRGCSDAIINHMVNGGDGAIGELGTGLGKSFTIADIIKQANIIQPGTRVLQLTHTKELIGQNYKSMQTYCPNAPIGINSAGLGVRDYDKQVIFGGIQSLYNKAKELGCFNLIGVDEAHLVNREQTSMYGQLITDLRAINPKLRIFGLTGTPFRTKCGMLHEGEDAIFNKIVYKYGLGEGVRDGYLTPPRTKSTGLKLDLPKKIGSWSDAKIERSVDIDEVTQAACAETIAYANKHGLRRWIIFGSGETHCQHIKEELNLQGVSAEVVTSRTPKKQREAIFTAFKKGLITALVNINIAAIGFDDPAVDLIASLRPTGAPGLWAQQVGRGCRLIDPSIGNLPTIEQRLVAIACGAKPYFHVLDFARNIERHGPIDQIRSYDTRTTGEGGEAPIKTCPTCSELVYAGTKICPCCEYEFPEAETKIDRTASTEVLLSSQIEPVWKKVTNVEYTKHIKKDGKISLKVTYWCGMVDRHQEWIAPGRRGNNWWFERDKNFPLPKTVEEMLIRSIDLIKPKRIKVIKSGKYWNILDYELGESNERF